MPISKIYLATHKQDLRFTRICVASIRFWYPDVPILLIKDEYNGTFSTREIEENWNVGIFDIGHRHFGWGLSKLEPIFAQNDERFLILDSDIVFVGRVLDDLNKYEEDFIVQREEQPQQAVEEIYFSLRKLKEYDPDFVFPDYTFNTGQIVAKGGLLRREDFEDLVNWSSVPPSLVHPQIFKNGDQGALNYVVMKKAARGELSVARVPFMKWKGEIENFDLAKIRSDSPYPFLIHWAGLKRSRLQDIIRADILLFFERVYYSRIAFGSLKRIMRPSFDWVSALKTRIIKKIGRRV